jgi:hypothetical protein
MLRGDAEAIRRLHGAGAQAPGGIVGAALDADRAALAASVMKMDAMIVAADLGATLAWYQASGFELTDKHEANGVIDWAGLTLGGSYLMLVPGMTPGASPGVSLWFRTKNVDGLYHALKRRQMERARLELHGEAPADPAIRFVGDLHDTHHGLRMFSIRDPNGCVLYFAQC